MTSTFIYDDFLFAFKMTKPSQNVVKIAFYLAWKSYCTAPGVGIGVGIGVGGSGVGLSKMLKFLR